MTELNDELFRASFESFLWHLLENLPSTSSPQESYGQDDIHYYYRQLLISSRFSMLLVSFNVMVIFIVMVSPTNHD